MYAIHDGVVGRGFQFASGEAVGRNVDPSPFSRGTLRLQDAHFQARGFDLADAIPGLHWGTVNVELGVELVLASPDLTLSLVDWTAGESDPAARIAPESFSFVRCCLAHDGNFHAGYIYYPHPETKPATNAHRYHVLEVLTHRVDGLAYGEPASVICRSDAFALKTK